MQFGPQFLQAPPRLIDGDRRQGADELVTAHAHDQIVRARVAPESGHHIL